MKIFRHILFATLLTAGQLVYASSPKVIAHRGYWKTEGASQNSIRSLVKSDSVGCHASEFDVWMTLDSVLVVNHDAGINGVTIQTSPSDIVLAQKLSNGENVPTLEQYLATASALPSRLVCELKEHDSRSRETAAVKKIVELMQKYGLQDKVDYITFSRDAYRNFIRFAPEGTPVYYLTGDYIPAQIKETGGAGIDYSIGTMRKHPEWIQQAHDLGLLVNIWTVDKDDDMIWCIDNGADFITTNEPEKLQRIIESRQK